MLFKYFFIFLVVFHNSEQFNLTSFQGRIKENLSSLFRVFKEEFSCIQADWCKDVASKECEAPLTNRTLCCLYCPSANSTTEITTNNDLDIETTTLDPIRPKQAEKIVQIDETDPENIVIYKKVAERIPKGCPTKLIGNIGCKIEETCQKDSNCLTSQRCCLVDCKRTCINI